MLKFFMKLQGKKSLVTGASTGIGEAIAKAFEQEGAEVIWTSRSIEGKEGGISFKSDLTSTEDIRNLTNFAKEKFGTIDIIVNAAAIWHTKDKVLAGMDYENFTEDEIVNTMQVGIIAPMLIVNQLLPVINSGGKIVNITGTFENGGKGWMPYFVSKQALEKFTEGMAEELQEKNIQVNTVSPSDTLTEAYQKFFPDEAKPENCVTPEEVAQKVIEFCDAESSETGQVTIVKKLS